MQSEEMVRLIRLLSKLPGLGPRSGRRAALHLIKNKETSLAPLTQALQEAQKAIKTCSTCGNLDVCSPCSLCSNPGRDKKTLCIVEDVSDLWALERGASFKGLYHVLGGTLSALAGIGPEELKIPDLINRIQEENIEEVILALNATIEGQTTAHYIQSQLETLPIRITALAHGVPIGGELDYLDDGTLTTALTARRSL